MEANFENRSYVIFDVTEINTINFDEVLQTNAQSLRKSVDGTKTFVKYDGGVMPTSVAALTTKQGPFTHEQILSTLSSTEWTNPDDLNI